MSTVELELKAIRDEIVGRIASGDGRHDALQKQVDAIDRLVQGGWHASGGGGEFLTKSLGERFVESAEFQAAAAGNFLGLRSGKISVSLDGTGPFSGRKSTITSTSGLTQGVTGVSMPLRLEGVTGIAQQQLRIRDLMGEPRKMTTGSSFDFVRQTTRTNAASPQVETSPKAESTYAWDSVSALVKTIAHFVNVSRQALDDVPWLQSVLDSELRYGLLLKEESEILAGDGLGSHLAGLIPQATAYAGTYNTAADTRLDKLRKAKLEARLAGLGTFAPDGYVLNPVDMMRLEVLKEESGGANTGLYIIGNPVTGPTVKLLWGLPVVESDSIVAGTFLVGAFGTAVEFIERQSALVELSYENQDNFVRNVVTVLCESRIGLAVRKPSAFITGAF